MADRGKSQTQKAKEILTEQMERVKRQEEIDRDILDQTQSSQYSAIY